MRGKVVRIRMEVARLMRYVSTRGAWHDAPQPFRAILLEGLAPDGGLAVPERYPRFDAAELAALRPLDYRALAFAVLSRFIDDIPPADAARASIDDTYTAASFGSDEITPLLTLEPGLHLLRVSNGPTLAFKDIALQLLGRLFEHVLADGAPHAQHRRRDVGRHRQLGRVRDARQARRGRVHAVAERRA